MSLYLNTVSSLAKFKELINSKYYIDKSSIIEKLNDCICTTDKYICITKPRRFGKSSIINMLGAYYSKNLNTSDVFNNLNISKCNNYKKHINKYNVISISFNDIPQNMNTYEEYINNIVDDIKIEIKNNYKEIEYSENMEIYKMLSLTNEKFIFIIDEWDYIFSHNLFCDRQRDFLEFLRNLLKDRSYVALCYMTGVLPIKKYSFRRFCSQYV